ncbi:MAG: riboflavin biosynthesis protein RibF [Candidatus Hinthialibacter antarcticus]|nr:riboflavin biosynthesis protein RibF [Candidatus Hinthialibacter antarcticus]
MIELTTIANCPFQPSDGVVCALGFFDGVHRAHQRIIQTCCERAKQRGGVSVVFTFQNHPSDVLQPNAPTPLLTPYALKKRWIETLAPDYLVAVPFTKELSQTRAEQFIQQSLIDCFHAREIVIGFNFTFGRNREGTPEALKQKTPAAFEHVTIIEPMSHNNEPISSSRIRQSVKNGDLDHSADLLGHTVQIAGSVVQGDLRGRSIGFPTANIDYSNQLLPPNGVYGVRVMRNQFDAEPVWGVMNIGVVPTFKDTPQRTVEIHLLDFNDDLYNEYLIVDVLMNIRAEQKFDGPQQLITQIHADIAAFRQWIINNN